MPFSALPVSFFQLAVVATTIPLPTAQTSQLKPCSSRAARAGPRQHGSIGLALSPGPGLSRFAWPKTPAGARNVLAMNTTIPWRGRSSTPQLRIAWRTYGRPVNHVDGNDISSAEVSSDSDSQTLQILHLAFPPSFLSSCGLAIPHRQMLTM